MTIKELLKEIVAEYGENEFFTDRLDDLMEQARKELEKPDPEPVGYVSSRAESGCLPVMDFISCQKTPYYCVPDYLD